MKLPTDYNKLSIKLKKRVREDYIRLQEGKCYHCGEPLDGPPSENIMKLRIVAKWFPKGFFDWPVHLHHDHDTGMTIGAVHAKCNAVLWQYHGE